MTTTRVLISCSLLAVLSVPLQAQAITDRLLVTGTLAFDGEATLGDFTGTTTTVAGRLVGAEGLSAIRGYVTAPARSLVTGNDHRDRDMYKSLEADQFPQIRYDVVGVRAGRIDGDSTAVSLRGRFTIHGVTRDAEIPGWAWLGQDVTRFRGATPLNLTDYKIGGLSKLLGTLKMHEEIVVRVDLTFKP
ncbi:MAG: YceI family protein [Gemmatimonadota bacterium]